MNVMRRFTFQSLIFDATVTLCIAARTGLKPAIICKFSFVAQEISLISRTREQHEILCKRLHISYIDQFVSPPIFNYLIGANDVDVEEW